MAAGFTLLTARSAYRHRKDKNKTYPKNQLNKQHKLHTLKSPRLRGFQVNIGCRWILKWCPEPDLNRHGLRHYPLKIACLPIPPPGLIRLLIYCRNITLTICHFRCNNRKVTFRACGFRIENRHFRFFYNIFYCGNA